MSDTSQNQGDTGNGFIAGVQPAQPRLANEFPAQNAAQSVSQPVQIVPSHQLTSQPYTGQLFTAEDIERARQQEKEKLYGRIEQMDGSLKQLQKERDDAEKARKAEEKRIADEAKAKEQEDMDVRQLLAQQRAEMEQRIASIEAERERDRATFEMERKFNEIEQYKTAMILQNEALIMPELRDLIRGNTIEEIDASVQDMINRTNAVFSQIGAVPSQQISQPPRAASPYAPGVGPMEQQQSHQQLTNEDIRSMDLDTYKKNRDQLLAAARRSMTGR